MSNHDEIKKLFLGENNKFKITPIEITFMPSKDSHFFFQGKFERLEDRVAKSCLFRGVRETLPLPDGFENFVHPRIEGKTIDLHEDHIQDFDTTFYHYMLPVFKKSNRR